MPSGLNSAMSVPGHGVSQTRLNCDDADRAKPALALLGVGTIGLLDREFNPAFYNCVRKRHAKHRNIKFAILRLFSSSASSSPHV